MIAVVVTTHGGSAQMLDRCLTAVRDSGDADLVIVVDNGDRAVDTRRDVVVLRTVNRGFGAAANHGIEHARRRGADLVAVINDDVVVSKGWLSPLVTVLVDDPAVGAVQPKLLLTGSDPPLINSMGVGVDAEGTGRDIGLGRPDGPEFERAADIVAFTGGAVLFRDAFLQVTGGFDERFFLYYEDVDLALRGARSGWRYRCQPQSVVWHEGGVSTAALGSRRAMLFERNRLWCLFRHGEPASIARGIWLSIRRLRHRPRRAHASGLARALLGAPRWLSSRR